MNRLIKNEFIKVKKIRVFLFQSLFIISLILIKKLSNQNLFDLSFNLIPFVGIILCILFGGTINGEIENGTMRFYLSKPFKRWKVYLAKLLSMIIFIFVTIVMLVITTCILNHKFDSNYVLKYFLHCLPLIFMCFFSIYLSVRFKSQVLSITISILIFCFSLIIAQLFFGLEITIIQYSFLPYLDYSIFNDKSILINMNKELNISLSQNKAIIINIVYSILFFIFGIIKFNKKDIKC